MERQNIIRFCEICNENIARTNASRLWKTCVIKVLRTIWERQGNLLIDIYVRKAINLRKIQKQLEQKCYINVYKWQERKTMFFALNLSLFFLHCTLRKEGNPKKYKRIP